MSKDELEKEAEEINITYENNVFHCTKNGTKWISIDGEKWYGEEKRIEELEKENAELKRLRCCENCKNVSLQLHWKESKEIDERRQFVCGTCGNRKHWEYLGKTVGITETQQLTKATEIIKGLYFIIQSRIDYENNTGIADEMWRAEQFLEKVK